MTGCGEVPTRSLADDAQQHVGLLPATAGSHDCEIDGPARGVFGCSSTLGPMPTK
jgi:hypothetical protein